MLPFLVVLYSFIRSLKDGMKDPEFRTLLVLALILLISGTIFYHEEEGWRLLDSFYFSTTTLTTVGLGDFTPHTDIGKLFTIFYIFIGLGIIFGFINSMSHHTKKNTSIHKLLNGKKKR